MPVRKVRRKTQCRSIPEFALDDTRRQVDEYKHFLELVSWFTEINEMLCDRRLKLRRSEKNMLPRRRQDSTMRSVLKC